MKKLSVVLSATLLIGVVGFSVSISAEESARDRRKAELLAENYPAEMHLPAPGHKGEPAVLVWNEDGIVYTTTTNDDPRVDSNFETRLTPQQEEILDQEFPEEPAK